MQRGVLQRARTALSHDRACEPKLGLETERGHGGADVRWQVVALQSSSRLVLARAGGSEPCGWGSARRPSTALRLEGSSLRDWLQAGGLELDMHPYRSRLCLWSLTRTRCRRSRMTSGNSRRRDAAVARSWQSCFELEGGGLGWEQPQCRRPRLIHSTDGRRTEATKEEPL